MASDPFSLAEAIAAAPEGGMINLKAGSSNESIMISKAVTLQSYWGGPVTIGR